MIQNLILKDGSKFGFCSTLALFKSGAWGYIAGAWDPSLPESFPEFSTIRRWRQPTILRSRRQPFNIIKDVIFTHISKMWYESVPPLQLLPHISKMERS